MNVYNKKITDKVFTLLIAVFVTLSSGVSHADDIEIYEAISNAQIAIGDGEFNPNILFVLDNSGSMKDFRVIAEGSATVTYDPTKIYPLMSNGDNANDLNNDYYIYTDRSFAGSGIRLQPNRNNCQASIDFLNNAANAADPVYEDTLAQWKYSSRYGWYWWNTINQTNESRRKIECRADNGVHGKNGGANKFLNHCPNADCGENDRYLSTQQTVRGGTIFPWDVVDDGFYGDFDSTRVIVSGNFHEYLQDRVDVDNVARGCSSNDQIINNSDTDNQDFRCLQKLVIMKRALSNIVAPTAADPTAVPPVEATTGVSGVNLGLMRFNRNRDNGTAPGGTLTDAVANVNAVMQDASGNDVVDGSGNPVTNRTDFLTKLNAIKFEGNTPLAESMYEAYRYFNGNTPDTSETTTSVTGQGLLDVSALDGTNFDSPIGTNQCQDNYAILLSDGLPTVDNSRDTQITALPEANPTGETGCVDGGEDEDDASCLNEVTRALQKNLKVTTFTIGFDIDLPLLEAAANDGAPDGAEPGSGYFQATDLSSLEDAFTSILSEIQRVENDNFVAPAVTVNAFNRLQNRSDIYYAVFRPESNPRWDGNLKKYRISTDATIRDALDANAIDASTGFFSETSKSFWSDSVDGNRVTDGGFSNELETTRNLFASLDATATVTALATVADADAVTTFSNIIIGEDVTGAIIGVDQSLAGTLSTTVNNNTAREQNLNNIVRFSLGVDVESGAGTVATPAPNMFAAESIHSTPYVLSYGTTEANPVDIVFLTTNQGMLHAISGQGAADGGAAGTVGGDERWAYIPDESLLENLGGYFNRGLNGSNDHIYGLDGEIAFDVERDAAAAITKSHLFFGQRRGGSKYFAVDVTRANEATTPVSKLWTVEGGSGDLARMGQSWAKPVVTNFRQCVSGTCTQKRALVVAGGYDTDYDDASKDIADLADGTAVTGGPNQDTLGNAIYILDAADGSVLWSASNTNARVTASRGDVVVAEMDHSIPAPPTVLDINQDGAIDTMFATDISGQIFRFDFRQNAAGTVETREGDIIANLQESGVNRRFFNPVDAVLLPGVQARIALVTGSGYRAHPLDKNDAPNRFFVVYDENINGPLLDESGNAEYEYVEITDDEGVVIERDLIKFNDGDTPIVDATNSLDPLLTHLHGYYIPLADTANDEKVLNPTLISDFQVIGVTYSPDLSVTNTCSAAPGRSSVYQLNLLTGEATRTLLSKPGVSAAPVLVYVLEEDPDTGKEELKPIVIIGTEPFAGEDFDLRVPNLGKAEKKAWWEYGRGNLN